MTRSTKLSQTIYSNERRPLVPHKQKRDYIVDAIVAMIFIAALGIAAALHYEFFR